MFLEVGFQGYPMRRSRRSISPGKAAATAVLWLLFAIAVLFAAMMLFGHYQYGQPINLFIGCVLMAIVFFPETRLDWTWRCVLPFVIMAFFLSF